MRVFQRPPYAHGFSDDLLCFEDSRIVDGDPDESSTDLELQIDIQESIDILVEDERSYVPGLERSMLQSQPPLDGPARKESIAWILKVHAVNKFHPVTAYLSVNFIDRFLYSRRFPEKNGWQLQLLSVTCLWLAAKMEETRLPSLSDLQVEDAKFIFEAGVIERMELLVLGALEWRLRTITPFHFLHFFACKRDPEQNWTEFLVTRATRIILESISETSFLDYKPSCMALVAILRAAREIPYLSPVNDVGGVLSWCDGLSRSRIVGCKCLMRGQQHLVVESSPPDALPQLGVTTTHAGVISDSSLSSPSSPPSHKRRKTCSCPSSPSPPAPSSSSN